MGVNEQYFVRIEYGKNAMYSTLRDYLHILEILQ